MSERATPSTAVLDRLLNGTAAEERESAWAALVSQHSRLLLHVARKVIPEHDGAMDAYAHVLERLRENDYRRLRGYVVDPTSTFSTWLVIVARRLCLDYYRSRYGRPSRSVHDADGAEETRASRRRLLDLATSDLTALKDESQDQPEHRMRSEELQAILEGALATLSLDDRLLLRLRFDDGLSAQRIAIVMKWRTPFHVYRRLNAVLAELRRRLVARGVEGSAP